MPASLKKSTVQLSRRTFTAVEVDGIEMFRSAAHDGPVDKARMAALYQEINPDADVTATRGLAGYPLVRVPLTTKEN